MRQVLSGLLVLSSPLLPQPQQKAEPASSPASVATSPQGQPHNDVRPGGRIGIHFLPLCFLSGSR